MRLDRVLALLLFLLAGAGCRVRESREAAVARVTQSFLASQITGLEALVAQADRGELVTTDQIAVSIDERAARELVNATLPQEQVIAGRVRVRIESAEIFFRGSRGAIFFRARATGQALPDAFAELELGGGLEDVKLVSGTLSARAQLLHFSIVRASVGPLAEGALESLVRQNLGVLQDAIPPLEIPVHLEEQVAIDGFDEGPVSVKGGSLPIQAKVSHVLYSQKRLWVLIDARVGDWSPAGRPPS